MEDDVTSARQKRASYWTSDGRMSPGLLRAREPFRARNAMTGAAVLSAVGLIYFYSIAAVKQDDFSDVPAPSADQRDRIRREMDEEKARASVPEEVSRKKGGGGGVNKEGQETARLPSLGLLGSAAFLSARVREEGLVEGAPPLDRLGTSRDRSTAAGQPRQV